MGCRNGKPSSLGTPRGSSSALPPPSPRPVSPRTASHGSIGSIVSHLITPVHKRALAATWSALSTRQQEIGMRVFYVIFARDPDVKRLFPFRDAEGDDLDAHPAFRAHALHFMRVINDAVCNLDDLECTLGRRLLALGAQHAHMKGFSLDYFEVFTGGLQEVWARELDADWTTDAHAAWEKLFLYIMMELRSGYMMELEGEKQEAMENGIMGSTPVPPEERNGIELVPPRVIVSPPLSGPGTT